LYSPYKSFSPLFTRPFRTWPVDDRRCEVRNVLNNSNPALSQTSAATVEKIWRCDERERTTRANANENFLSQKPTFDFKEIERALFFLCCSLVLSFEPCLTVFSLPPSAPQAQAGVFLPFPQPFLFQESTDVGRGGSRLVSPDYCRFRTRIRTRKKSSCITFLPHSHKQPSPLKAHLESRQGRLIRSRRPRTFALTSLSLMLLLPRSATSWSVSTFSFLTPCALADLLSFPCFPFLSRQYKVRNACHLHVSTTITQLLAPPLGDLTTFSLSHFLFLCVHSAFSPFFFVFWSCSLFPLVSRCSTTSIQPLARTKEVRRESRARQP
jgi:hypothetical protein